jgi:pescadillo protein
MPEDVDYRVMTTFFEFYDTLLNFVLYKLYTDLGVRYPLPSIEAGDVVKGSTSYILGANLRSLTNAFSASSGAITDVVSGTVEDKDEVEPSKGKSKAEKKKSKELIKTVGAALNSINEDSDDSDDDDDEKDVDIAGPLKAALENMADEEARTLPGGADTEIDDEALKRRRLFSGLTFFLSREVPRGYLELVILAFGGKVGWEGSNSPIAANDPTITHHIVDRPKLPSSYDSFPKSREYVQPQWVLDCTNFMFILPIAKYECGASLPPHLSPWVDNEEEGYKPKYAEDIERLKNGDAVLPDVQEIDAESGDAEEELEAAENDSSEDEDEEPEEKPNKASLKKKKARAAKRQEKEVSLKCHQVFKLYENYFSTFFSFAFHRRRRRMLLPRP